MKKLLIASVIGLTSFANFAAAGAVAYVAPEAPDTMVAETAPMGSSGAWIIPLIAIALIALAISQNDEDEDFVE